MYTLTEEYKDCIDEQRFKNKYIKNTFSNDKVFCIETEETAPGFPDVLRIKGTTVDFYEFKISDARGTIKFQPSQPSFYKRNREMRIHVVAYNRRSKTVHTFSTEELFDYESPYRIDINARLNLCKAEE